MAVAAATAAPTAALPVRGAWILLLSVAVAWAATAGPRKLPDYIQTCSLKDPQLNACVLKHGRAALPRIMKGDPSFRIPPLDPLMVPEVLVQQGTRPTTLEMRSRGLVISGLAAGTFDDVKVDTRKRHFYAKFSFPRLELVSQYEVNGQVLVLPVRGTGESNFTFVDAIVEYFQPYTLEKRGDYRHMRTKPGHTKFNCSAAYFWLSNLFNGEPTLGDSVNKYLNENWRTVVDELAEPFIQAGTDVTRGLIDVVTDVVPYENIFRDAD